MQVQWVVEAWKQIDKEIIKKSFDTCGITTSDPDKIHCLGKGQPTEEARVHLGESNPSIEFVPRPTLEDIFQQKTDIYDIHNLEDLTIEIIIKTRGLTPCGLLTAIEAAHANCRHIVRTAKANSKV